MQNQPEKAVQQKGGRTMGLQILGWSLIVIGIIITLWGFFEFPMNQWLGLDFLSFAVSGVVLIAGGLAILKLPAVLIIAAILAAALLLVLYTWQMPLDFGVALISYIIIAALAIWLISLVLK
jgi:fatty acid desaturase